MLALLKAFLILALVALNAFFVAAEYALLSVRRTRLEQLANEGNPRARLVLTLVSDMVALFSGTQLGITVISLLMGWIGQGIMAGAIDGLLEGYLGRVARAALARLRELLESKGFTIVTQIRGPKISERLPKEYVLLHVTIPVAAVKTVEIDPLAPGALLLPMAVLPADGGGSVIATADPVGQVWLYGEPALIQIQSKVRERLAKVFEEL